MVSGSSVACPFRVNVQHRCRNCAMEHSIRLKYSLQIADTELESCRKTQTNKRERVFIFINSSRTSCQVQATRWVSPTLPYLTPTFFIKSIFVGHRIIQCNQLTLQQQINIRFLKGKGMPLRGKPLSDHRINRCRMYNIRPFGSGKCRQKNNSQSSFASSLVHHPASELQSIPALSTIWPLKGVHRFWPLA